MTFWLENLIYYNILRYKITTERFYLANEHMFALKTELMKTIELVALTVKKCIIFK